MDRVLTYLGVGGGALLVALSIDLFGTPALLAVSVVLVFAVAFRARLLAGAVAIGSALMFALATVAMARCDSSLQDCSLSPGIAVVMTWIAALGALAALATAVLSKRARHPV